MGGREYFSLSYLFTLVFFIIFTIVFIVIAGNSVLLFKSNEIFGVNVIIWKNLLLYTFIIFSLSFLVFCIVIEKEYYGIRIPRPKKESENKNE